MTHSLSTRTLSVLSSAPLSPVYCGHCAFEAVVTRSTAWSGSMRAEIDRAVILGLLCPVKHDRGCSRGVAGRAV